MQSLAIPRRYLLATIIGCALILGLHRGRAAEVPPPDGMKAYALRTDGHGGILRPDGTPVAIADLAAYVQAIGVNGTRIALLYISGPDDAKALGPAVKAMSGTFTNFIVQQWTPSAKLGATTIPASSPEKIRVEIAAAYPGKSLPAGDPHGAPTRPPELMPDAPPPKILYHFAGNSEVIAKAGLLLSYFTAGEANLAQFWAPAVMVGPGLWSQLRNDRQLGRKSPLHFNAKVPQRGGPPASFPMIVLRDGPEIAHLGSLLQQTAQADGGGRVRALSAAEMKAWWPFISFDLIEPVFVFETKNATHRYIVGFNQGGAAVVEELNSLPLLTMQPPAP